MRRIVVLLAACGTVPAGGPPDAASILRQASEVYANAKSYADEGESRWTEKDGGPESSVVYSFTTRFTRAAMRFDSKQLEPVELAGNTSTVWVEHARAYGVDVMSGAAGDVQEDDLLALLQEIGVTNHAALTVPHLLMPDEVADGGLDEYVKLELHGSEVVDGHDCWRLTGSDEGITDTVWIDKASYVLRKLASAGRVDSDDSHFDFTSTTTYAPRLDAAIAAAELAGPPGDRPAHEPTAWMGISIGKDERVRVVAAGSPGERAGVQVGDVLMSLDGHAIVGSMLTPRIRGSAIGETVLLGVHRGNRALELPVRLEDRPIILH